MQLYARHEAKLAAQLAATQCCNGRQRPFLIGTRSVADSEIISQRLAAAGLTHPLLNARQDRHAAQLIAQAGSPGGITVATNMAGRGTDIKLADCLRKRGLAGNTGGIECITAGRSAAVRTVARPGDPGRTAVITALEDRVFRDSLPVWLISILTRRWPQDPLPVRLARLLAYISHGSLARRVARLRQGLLLRDAAQVQRLAFFQWRNLLKRNPGGIDVVKAWRWLAGATLCTLIPATAQAALELEGLIEPSVVIELSSPGVGVIDSIAVEKAQSEEAPVALAKARSQRNDLIRYQRFNSRFAQRKPARFDKLAVSSAIPELERDKAQTEAERARMDLVRAENDKNIAAPELARAEALVEEKCIRSPVEGGIVQGYLNPGESVKDKAIVRITQIDPLKVEVPAQAALRSAIRVGMPAELIPEGPTEVRYPARVDLIDPVIDAASGSFGVRLRLDNADKNIGSGLRCRVRFGQHLAATAMPQKGSRVPYGSVPTSRDPCCILSRSSPDTCV